MLVAISLHRSPFRYLIALSASWHPMHVDRSIDGNYAIKYDYNEEELETLLQKVQLINAAGGNSTEQGYN